MKATIIAGDSLSLLYVAGDYPTAAGWVMKVRLVPRLAGATAVVITCAAEGDNHRLTAAGSATRSWKAGEYAWARWVEKGDEAYTLEQGQTTILPDPRTAPVGTDTRSAAARALEAAEQALASFRGSHGMQRRYKIGEREMEFAGVDEILREIRYWRGQVDDEEVAAGRRSMRSGVIKARL